MGEMKNRWLRGWPVCFVALAALWLGAATPAHAVILWSDPGVRLAHDTGAGVDMLHGAIEPQGKNSSSTLYFKFTVNPLSDISTEKVQANIYVAGLVFYEKNVEHLGIGNALRAWGYSAFNVSGSGPDNQTPGEWNFSSLNYEAETPLSYEAPRRDIPRTIVFKVQYVPGEDANITVWMNPNLNAGATEISQDRGLTTHFKANACFDEIHLVHRGGGAGWRFSNLAIATSFEDFVTQHLWQRTWFIGLMIFLLVALIASPAWIVERQRARGRIRELERERALEQERTRIARDIHDDLGSHLSQLAVLGEIMGNEVQNVEKAVFQVHKISASARNLLESLEAIVWAVRPENDSLQSLVEYMERRTDELFENAPMRYKFFPPPQMPAHKLHAEVRHNFFLSYKETLTNVLRHSEASSVSIEISFADEMFQVIIRDNGKGFDPQCPRRDGHGLNNIQRRMEEIGGQFELQSAPDRGTTSRLAIRIQHAKPRP